MAVKQKTDNENLIQVFQKIAKSINETAEKTAITLSKITLDTAAKVAGKELIDHDLLNTIKGKVEDIQEKVAKIESGTQKTLENHEIRIQNLKETTGTIKTKLNIGIALLIIMASMLIFHLFGVQI